jgi:hypothetical protein
VREWSGGWVVAAGGVMLAGPYKSRVAAERRLKTVLAVESKHSKPRQERRRIPCLTCRGLFLSEGPHNRMCPRCRWHHRDDGSFGLALPSRASRRAP